MPNILDYSLNLYDIVDEDLNECFDYFSQTRFESTQSSVNTNNPTRYMI